VAPRSGSRRAGLRLTLLALLVSACAGRSAEPSLIAAAVAAARDSPSEPVEGSARVETLGTTQLETVIPASPLRGANGLACRDGRLFVAVAAANRIAEVTSDGKVVPVSTPDDLSAPDDLTFAPDGSMLVTAMRSGSLWRRDPSERWTELDVPLPGANGVAVSPEGRTFVSQCFYGDGIAEIASLATPKARTVASDLGCPNGFFIDASGSLVVPLLEKGSVVRIDPNGGSSRALVSGLTAPTATGVDRDGKVLVLESATGAIVELSSSQGEAPSSTIAARLAPGLDDLVFCGQSLLVSNFVTGAIDAFKPWPGTARSLVPGGLVVPRGLLPRPDGLLVTDGIALKRYRSGKLDVLFATLLDPIAFPVGLAGDGEAVYVSSPETGTVHRLDLPARGVTVVAEGLEWPTSLAVTPTGELLIAETGAGRVLAVDAAGEQRDLATGLMSPVGLVVHHEVVYTAEPTGGRILALRPGEMPAVVASGLSWPAGLGVDERGRVVVAEASSGRLVRIGTGGTATPLATGLAFEGSGEARPLPIGVAVDGEGGVLVASPVDGSVHRFLAP
jgi:sugar lactone lactonase YvrE